MGQQVTLTAGMQQNLFSLQQTNKLMDMTQGRLASGKRVQSALDDPINFFAAKEHNQRAGDLNSRKDYMGEAVQTVKAASAGIEAMTDLINAAKSLAQSAISSTNTTEAASLQAQYNETKTQLESLAGNSGYKGNNLLDSDTITVKFSADGSKSLTVTGFAATGLGITAASDWQNGTMLLMQPRITQDIAELDSAITKLRTEESKLSNNLSIITSRQSFTDEHDQCP